MKHIENQELCQFRLDFENQLWCRREDSKISTCGSCPACICINKLHDTTEWLVQAGGALKLKFLMGVLIRCKSVDILKNTLKIIQVALGKDFTYSRSRQKSKVSDDLTTWSHKRTIDEKLHGTTVLETWDWFSGSTYWIKGNYIIGLLSLCETELLQALRNLIRVLIERERQASLLHDSVLDDLDNDTSSIPESHYTFSPEDRPELELLLRTRSASMVLDLPGYTRDPDCPEILPNIPLNSAPSKDQWESFLPKEAFCARLEVQGCRGGVPEERKGGAGTEALYPEEPALAVVPGTSASLSGVSRHQDFIRSLPVHLAKKILGLLDRPTLLSCSSVSQHWRFLTEEVQDEIETKRMVENQAMIMQGSSTACPRTTYSKMREVLVPTAEKQEDVVPEVGKDRGFESAYSGCSTKTVEMEEKNIFCGAYNILFLSNREDSSRVVHYSGGQLVAVGSRDRLVRLLDVWAMRRQSLVMQGHAGSIRAVHLCEDRGLVISTGYDLTIRCWDLRTGACTMLLRGHFGTINCLDLHGNTLVSGARDCRVKVWNLRTGRCLQRLRFKHESPVQCVRVGRGLILSSCDKGQLKLWDMNTGGLLKLIDSLQGSVKCLHLDQWHILSGGADGYAVAWSTSKEHTKSLMTYRHPREVLTFVFLFLRLITGCADGKIRVFDFLTGNCLRVIISNSQQSPVLSLHIHENNIVINTRASVLIFQFGEESREASEEGASEEEETDRDSPGSHSLSPALAHRTAQRGSSGAQRRPVRPATGLRLQRHPQSPDPNAKPPAPLCPGTGTRRARQRARITSSRSVREPVVQVKWGSGCAEGTKKRGSSHSPANKHAPAEASASQQPQLCKRSGCIVHGVVGAHEAWGAKVWLPGTTRRAPPAPSSAPSPPRRPLHSHQPRPFTTPPVVGWSQTGRDFGGEAEGKWPGVGYGMGSGKTVCRIGAITTTAERDVDPERCVFISAPCRRPGRRVGFCTTSDPDPDPAPAPVQAHPFDPFRRRSLFQVLTVRQQEEWEREVRRKHEEARAGERRREEKQRRRAWRMMAKGLPTALYRNEDQIYAPELGAGTYI